MAARLEQVSAISEAEKNLPKSFPSLPMMITAGATEELGIASLRTSAIAGLGWFGHMDRNKLV